MALLPSSGFLLITAAVFSILLSMFTATAWLTVAQDARLINEMSLADGAGLWLIGRGHQLDLEARELSVLWEVHWCAGSERSRVVGASASYLSTCGPFDRTLDIYLNDLSKPIFSYNPDTLPGEILLQDVLCFKTEHRIDTGAKHRYTEQLILPFDRYTLRAFATAVDPTTNRSVYITRFVIDRPLGSFVVESRDMDASGLPHRSANGRIASRPGSRIMIAEIRRSTTAQMFTLSLALINWVLTIGSIYVTAIVVSGKMEPNNAVAALPFSMMLTIPGVRALCSDVPTLSPSLDTAGFFVQIVTVALCQLVLVRTLTNHRFVPPHGYSV